MNPSCHAAGILIAALLVPSASQVSPASSASVSSSIKWGGAVFPDCLMHARFGATSSHRPSMAARAFSQENTQRQALREMFCSGREEGKIIEVKCESQQRVFCEARGK